MNLCNKQEVVPVEVFILMPFFDQETESSEEEEGISVEELKKTEEWSIFVKNVDAMHA